MDGKVSLGAVIRNGKGEVMVASGVEIASSNDVEVESDCLSLIQKLHVGKWLRSENGLLIEDIKHICPDISSRISYVHRNCNQVAHYIAKWATNQLSSSIWVELRKL